MKKNPLKIMLSRRQLLKAGVYTGIGLTFPWRYLVKNAAAYRLAYSLSDPALQPKFEEAAPNALHPEFLFKDFNQDGRPAQNPNFSIRAKETVQETGLIDPDNGRKLKTKVWGYGKDTVSWPGQTFQVMSALDGYNDFPETIVRWTNELKGKKHLLPVDTNVHWCYSLHGNTSRNGVDYRNYSIKKDGIPIITHLHGGNSDFQFDGNPEFFFSPDESVKGPQWDFAPDGFTNTFRYNNAVPAGNLWYHDHALGLTRLNVYAGLAGFYFIRDSQDTGLSDNPLGLPAFPYELAYAIQDRMFTEKGELFYPAFPGDPFYEGFIEEEEAELPPDLFPDGGPTALAEFFGDHMVVNGKIWPKTIVEPRNYRMRLLNGCDSRFLVLQFVQVESGDTDPASAPALPFYVIGSDQGLGTPEMTDTLVFEPGGRYDVVVDFSQVPFGSRVIMKNIGWDAPFGGHFGGVLNGGGPGDPTEDDLFMNRQTDRIMAFDVLDTMSDVSDNFNSGASLSEYGGVADPGGEIPIRRVALFEGKDEFGRLQPLLGTVEGNPEEVPGTATARTWAEQTTEKPELNSTEIWEIYNFTGDAHPIHLHLVSFEILGREEIAFHADEDNPQMVLQHNGQYGTVPAISNISVGNPVIKEPADGYYEPAPKDMVTVLPEQRARIKARFDKPGRYVWHCHILSHEDHEMMRVLEVIEP